MQQATTTSNSLLSTNFWNKHFKKSEYEFYTNNRNLLNLEKPSSKQKETIKILKTLNHIVSHSLKYLIALNQDVTKFATTLGQKKSAQINSPFTKHQLTALHIAVMKGKFNAVKSLVENGADITARDAYSWTPLHHAAALPSNEIYRYLKECLKSKDTEKDGPNISLSEIKTKFGANCKKIRELLGKRKHPIIQNPNISFEEADGQKKPISEAALDFEYSDEYRFPQDKFKALWKFKYNLKGLGIPTDQEFENYKKSPPAFTVKKDENLSQLVGVPCLGLFADRKMIKGSFLGKYTGICVKPPVNVPFTEAALGNLPPTYLYDKFDAEKLGNAMRLINDGWPNCISIANPDHGEGIPYSISLVVSEDVNEGEQLFYDYGTKGELVSLKWGKYILQRKEEMKKTFEIPMDEFIKTFTEKYETVKALRTAEAKIDFLNYETKITYLFNTPSAMLYLFLTNSLSPQDLYSLMSSEIVRELILPNLLNTQMLEGLIIKMIQFQEAVDFINDQEPEIKTKAMEFLLNQIGKLTTMQLLKGMYDVCKFVSENQELSHEEVIANWEICEAKMLEELPKYNFITDPESVFTIETKE